MGQVIERGQVLWYKFPYPNKRRPVVVLTRTEAIAHLGEVVVAQITTKDRAVPSQVMLDTRDGMPRSCAVNLHQINTVAKSKLGPVVCQLPAPRLAQIDDAIRFSLGLEL